MQIMTISLNYWTKICTLKLRYVQISLRLSLFSLTFLVSDDLKSFQLLTLNIVPLGHSDSVTVVKTSKSAVARPSTLLILTLFDCASVSFLILSFTPPVSFSLSLHLSLCVCLSLFFLHFLPTVSLGKYQT